MNDTDTDNERPQPVARRPYEAPSIEETGSFERLVLACSHLPDEPLCEIAGDTTS